MRPSADFDQALTVVDHGLDQGKQRFKPIKKGTPTGVAESYPDDPRPGPGLLPPHREILVLGEDDQVVLQSVLPNRGIRNGLEAKIDDVVRLMAKRSQEAGQRRWKLRIDEEAHGSASEEDGMIGLSRSVFEASGNIGGIQVGEVLKDLRLGIASSEQIEHVLDSDAHAPDARPATALVGVEGNALFHAGSMPWKRVGVKWGDSNLVADRQEHNGEVNTDTSLKIAYSYENGAANTVRPTTLTSPGGTVITSGYESATADALAVPTKSRKPPPSSPP